MARSAREPQCRAETAQRRAAPELRARDRPAARRRAVLAAADLPSARPPGRERAVLVRVEWAPPAQAGDSSPGTVATEPAATVLRRVAMGRGRQVARPRAGRCCPERLGPAQAGRAPPARTERLQAAGPAPSAAAPGGAGRNRQELPKRWAEPAERPAGRAKVVARSGRGPDAAARSGRSKADAARPAEKAERPDRAQGPAAAPGDAAARARPGSPAVRPAARSGGAARSDSSRPGVPARRDGQPAAGPVQDGRRDAPGHLGRGAPARRAAGDAGPAGRHRRAAPARAGAMERRNCPATTGWRG